MWAAVYYHNHDVRIEKVPLPTIGPGEVLIKVRRSGICGSDVMEWYRRPRAPLVLGHEVAGEIAAVGAGVSGYREGDRVTAAHHVPCGACWHCRSGHETICDLLHRTNFDPGGFAEYVRLTSAHVDRGLFRLPDHLADEEAIFVEPLACVLRAQRIARLEPGQSAIVIGSGIAGLLHVKLARARGAGRIIATDISAYRLDAARRMGADSALSAEEAQPERILALNDGNLADLVVVCTGAADAIAGAFRLAAPGGTIMLFAPPRPDFVLPLNLTASFWRTDLTLTTSYGGAPADYAAALDLIASGIVRLKDMITHRLGLSEAALGFRLVAEADRSIKIVLDHNR